MPAIAAFNVTRQVVLKAAEEHCWMFLERPTTILRRKSSRTDGEWGEPDRRTREEVA
jgi:hypothetical protein